MQVVALKASSMQAALTYLLKQREPVEFADLCCALHTPRAQQAALELALNTSARTVRTKRGLYTHAWSHYATAIAAAADHVAVPVRRWLDEHAPDAPDKPLIVNYIHQHLARYDLHAISSTTVRKETTYNLHDRESLAQALDAAGYGGMAAADLYQEYAAAYQDVQTLIHANRARCFHGRVWSCLVMCQLPEADCTLSPFGVG